MQVGVKVVTDTPRSMFRHCRYGMGCVTFAQVLRGLCAAEQLVMKIIVHALTDRMFYDIVKDMDMILVNQR